MRAAWVLLVLGAAAEAQVSLPPYQRRVLGNGVVLNMVAQREVPMITLVAVARGGGEADPPEKAGLGWITAEMLRHGSGEMSAVSFSEELDRMGADFRTSVDRQSAAIRMEFLKKDAARALELFSAAILEPTFPEDELDKVLLQAIDQARALKDAPLAATAAYFRAFFFPPDHPYSRLAAGDETSLPEITREDVVQHHGRLYKGRNLIVVASGDVDAAFGDLLARSFGRVAAGTAYSWVKQAPGLARGEARLLLVDKPDATQAYFRIGMPGVHRTHPDRVGLWLVNTVFGGRFTSMLNDELRVNSGLTYGAQSVVEQDRLQGAIQISSYTQTETAAKAIDMALAVVNRLRSDGIDAEQLASAKAYIKGRFPTDRLETADQLAEVVAELELFTLGRAEIDELFAKIDAVTLEQANALARNYIQAEKLQFCLLGNARDLRPITDQYASKVEVVSIREEGFRAPEF